MPDRGDVQDLQDALSVVSDSAKEKLAWLFSSIDQRYPVKVRDALLEALPALVREHGDQAAAVAADWYEGVALREAGKKARVRVKGGYPEDAITRRVRSAMGHAFQGNAERALEVLQTSLDKFVKQSARNTIVGAAERDGVMWERVPSGATTCGFCLLLASRGWAYTSEHKAKFRKKDGDTYHGNCDCMPVPSFDATPPRIEGYDPDGLYQEYQSARAKVGSDPTAIADEMGRRAVARAEASRYNAAAYHSVEEWADAPLDMGGIIAAQGWQGRIEQLSDEAFDAFTPESPRIYRGVKDLDNGTSARDLHLAFLNDDAPWIGDGVYGQGWYTSTRLSTANQYAAKGSMFAPNDTRDHIGTSVVELALRPEAKVVRIDDVPAAGKGEKARVAALQGYDAMAVPGPRPGEWYYLVFNRTSLVARELKQ
ncbi:MAG: hypothetical protein QM630_09650 [Microbacterium sp.]